MTKSKLIVLCAGGHAKVLVDALKLQLKDVLGFTDASADKKGQMILGVPVLGNDEVLEQFSLDEIELVNGLGSVNNLSNRRNMFEKYKSLGFRFSNVIHPSAILAPEIQLGEGVQIMAGVVIQTHTEIGKNTLINTRASIDHDCRIGEHVHIAPGATLSGGVQIGNNVHVGAGSTIIQGVKVGNNVLIAAGAVVVKDVTDGTIVAGIPAREIRNE